jgi:tetratricopeptide (TPR) repeat protein
MITLGFIYWNYEVEEKPWLEELAGEVRGALYGISKDRKWVNEEIYPLAIAGVIIFAIMYQYNILPYKMLQGTIDGQRQWANPNLTSEQKVDRTIAAYKEALSLNTVLDRDSRTSLNRIFAGNPGALRSLSTEKALEVMDYNIELAKANVEYNEEDSMNQMILAQLYNTASSIAKDDPEKFAYYSNQALESIQASIDASPGRVPIYYQKAQIYITRGEMDNALNTLKEALALHPGYYDSSCHLAKTLEYYNKNDEAWPYYDACIDLGGASLLQPMAVVGKLINHYLEQEDYDRVIELYKQATNLEKNNVKNWISLAQLYQQEGMIDKAKEAAEKAITLDPTIKDYAEDFISNLE